MTRLESAAVEYARRGFFVFPVELCGKRPLTLDGFKSATRDPARVAEWWAHEPEANIGAVPGRSGLIVIDVDGDPGRREATRLGLLAEPTLQVETARGVHLWFERPFEDIGNRKLADGLDVRCDRGYVLLPPSVHPTGAIYRALGKLDEIRALPGPVVEMLRPREPTRPGMYDKPPIDAGTPKRVRYVQRAIELECTDLAQTGEGGRNNKLNEAAFSLGRFIQTGEADPAKLADVLTFAARQAGLEDWEIERTITSAFRAREVAA